MTKNNDPSLFWPVKINKKWLNYLAMNTLYTRYWLWILFFKLFPIKQYNTLCLHLLRYCNTPGVLISVRCRRVLSLCTVKTAPEMPSAMCVSLGFCLCGVCEGGELVIQCNWSLIVLDRSDAHSKPQRQNKLGSISLSLSWLIIPFFGLICCLLVLFELAVCLFVCMFWGVWVSWRSNLMWEELQRRWGTLRNRGYKREREQCERILRHESRVLYFIY